MTDIVTSRRFRSDPASIAQEESWGRASAEAALIRDTIIVTVYGEIDATNAAHFAAYVERRGAVASRLYLDLRDVDFFGIAGLTALRRLEHRFEMAGAPWRLVAGPAVRKVLRICNATDLPQVDSLDHVVGWQHPRAAVAAG